MSAFRMNDGRVRPTSAVAQYKKRTLNHDQPGTLVYWITSSARSSNDCGIVRPSAFAVFRLSPARTCNAVRPVHYRTDRQKMVAHTLTIALAHGVGNDRHSPDGLSTNAFAIQGN